MYFTYDVSIINTRSCRNEIVLLHESAKTECIGNFYTFLTIHDITI